MTDKMEACQSKVVKTFLLLLLLVLAIYWLQVVSFESKPYFLPTDQFDILLYTCKCEEQDNIFNELM